RVHGCPPPSESRSRDLAALLLARLDGFGSIDPLSDHLRTPADPNPRKLQAWRVPPSGSGPPPRISRPPISFRFLAVVPGPRCPRGQEAGVGGANKPGSSVANRSTSLGPSVSL